MLQGIVSRFTSLFLSSLSPPFLLSTSSKNILLHPFLFSLLFIHISFHFASIFRHFPFFFHFFFFLFPNIPFIGFHFFILRHVCNSHWFAVSSFTGSFIFILCSCNWQQILIFFILFFWFGEIVRFYLFLIDFDQFKRKKKEIIIIVGGIFL